MAELNNTSTVRFELFVSHGTATVLVCQSVPQKKKKKLQFLNRMQNQLLLEIGRCEYEGCILMDWWKYFGF